MKKLTFWSAHKNPALKSTVKSCFSGRGTVITAVYSSNSKEEPASAGISSGHEETSTAGREPHQGHQGPSCSPLDGHGGGAGTSPPARVRARPTFPRSSPHPPGAAQAGWAFQVLGTREGLDEPSQELRTTCPGQPLPSSPAHSQVLPCNLARSGRVPQALRRRPPPNLAGEGASKAAAPPR